MAKKEKKIVSEYRSKIRWGTFGMLVLLVVSAVYVVPEKFNDVNNTVKEKIGIGFPIVQAEPFNLGLDLQGGAHLIYEADTNGIESGEEKAAVEGVRDVIERRINGIGVAEANVQTTLVGKDYRIIVELPGVSDVNQAISMIGETPVLEFKEQNQEPPRELTEEEKIILEQNNKDEKIRADEVKQKLLEGTDFSELAKEYSDDTYSKEQGGYLHFVGEGAIEEETFNWAKTAGEGEILSEPIENEFGYVFLKRGVKREAEPQVEASHILVCYKGADGCTNEQYTQEQALEKAQEVFEQANADNFAVLVLEHSTDLGSKETGGSLGTFGRGMMVEQFDEAVFSATAGDIVGPVETQFGYHIIYKTKDITPEEIELWRIFVRKTVEQDIIPALEQWVSTGLSGKQLDKTTVVTDSQTSQIQVSLRFNAEGAELFSEITERNIQKPVAIFLDGEPISTPNVNQVINNGEAVISGSFTIPEAQLLSQRLNAGALPVPVELISQQTIGATLGAESLAKSLYAGIVAILVVMTFMFLYYRLPGFLSVISLTLYIFATLSLYKVIGVTLTLSGIAGMILSIGMAVDANVLIFERIKEELKEGKSLRSAIEEGFLRAWPSIRDGNISTLITSFILMGFGSSFVKGFAVTLSMGILVSMFSAITVTRTFLRFVEPHFSKKCGWMFLGNSKKK
jgi:protein-export membrane protein SecD